MRKSETPALMWGRFTHMTIRFRASGAAWLMLAAAASPADAGGFAQGSADTDILFADEAVAMRASVTVVAPTRRYSSNPGNPEIEGRNYAVTHELPSFAVKVNLSDALRCAGTYVKALGGEADYGQPRNAAQPKAVLSGIANAGKLEEEFSVYETGLTCAVAFGLGAGEAYFIGGVFREEFSYNRLDILTANGRPGVADGTAIGKARLDYDEKQYGYRLGAAYAIPEIALRAALIYRSGTTYDPKGELEIETQAGVSVLDAYGAGNLPQSLTFTFQLGIAEDWLALGAVTWADWSVMQEFVSQSYWAPGVPGPGSVNEYHWRDGWTLTGGIGHQFNEQLSGLLALTWDRGVATGYDHASATWTLSGGIAADAPWGGMLSAGGGFTHIAASEETRYGAANTAVEAGWAYALNVGYRVGW